MFTNTRDKPITYEIRVAGHLTDQMANWFDGMSLTQHANGETSLCGLVTDQAELFGLLRNVRDFGLELIAVQRI